MTQTRERMAHLVHDVQNTICTALEKIDGGVFREDRWERSGGGGGVSRILQDSHVFEKAGVNVSEVFGILPKAAERPMSGANNSSGMSDLRFHAVGISLVLHPHNPMAPTVHANYRYFERGDMGSRDSAWWFGGGADLTPAYLFEEDAAHFHRVHKQACDQHDPSYYPRFKIWCDSYFRITHRQESRGIGGIFFDDLCDRPSHELLAFAESCARSFVAAYVPILERRKDLPYSNANKRWQRLRRGRYVEFNLVYDRGTAFGLKTDGRVESILMSLPLEARWEYDYTPRPESEEDKLVQVLRTPREWA